MVIVSFAAAYCIVIIKYSIFCNNNVYTYTIITMLLLLLNNVIVIIKAIILRIIIMYKIYIII